MEVSLLCYRGEITLDLLRCISHAHMRAHMRVSSAERIVGCKVSKKFFVLNRLFG